MVDLAVPKTIRWAWNFGSLLGGVLGLQILRGLFLSFHYVNCEILAFSRVLELSERVRRGWMLRAFHANGASLFFVFMYLHVGRGLYYGSFNYFKTWIVGVSIFLMVMIVAFLGYVLPWGQISFWGATVITGLFSAIPYLGGSIVEWIWGGYSVRRVTLTRFFGFHFVLPFVIIFLVFLHILFLHDTGSNNPLGLRVGGEKYSFFPFFMLKDRVGFLIGGIILVLLGTIFPDLLGDAENFNISNSLSTPVHIQPEWYYLFAYAILRSIPRKLGGVVALIGSVLILYLVPFLGRGGVRVRLIFNKVWFWWFVFVLGLLTWVGACPVEAPYIIVGQILTVLYFSYFLSLSYKHRL